MARSHRTRMTGRTWTPCLAFAAYDKPVRLAVRVTLRRVDELDEAELPGSDPRQVRLSRLLRTYDGPSSHDQGMTR